MRWGEIYQEEPGGSFTHDGREYLLNPLLKFTDRLPVIEFPVEKLSWIVNYPIKDEYEYADISVPILVTKWNNKWVVIDGYHRLLKSMNLKKDTIPAKKVSGKLLSHFEIDKGDK